MSYLLDTNILSEFTRPRPEPRVVQWLDSLEEHQVFLSVVTLAEIRRGIELLGQGVRRDRLTHWLEQELPERFEERRILPVDLQVAEVWGVLVARGAARGITLHTMDGFILATAAVHSLILATRNVRDFDRFGLPLFNPWNEG